MSTKTPSIRETQENRRTAKDDAQGTGPDLVLRDESDAIIDDLKKQLADLQAQLNVHRARKPPEGEGEWIIGPGAVDVGLTPHIASRMRVPAQQLAGRLEALVGEVDDPRLKAELEEARETARFLLDTFDRITDDHTVLTTQLTADALVIEGVELMGRLETSLHERGWEVETAADSALPGRLALATESLLTVFATLVELSGELFGQPVRLSVGCPGAVDAPVGEQCELILRLACDQVWEGAPPGDSVSMAVMQAGIQSPGTVDLLYVEKIIEMRGGNVGFLTEGGQPRGFEVRLPITVLEAVTG